MRVFPGFDDGKERDMHHVVHTHDRSRPDQAAAMGMQQVLRAGRLGGVPPEHALEWPHIDLPRLEAAYRLANTLDLDLVAWSGCNLE